MTHGKEKKKTVTQACLACQLDVTSIARFVNLSFALFQIIVPVLLHVNILFTRVLLKRDPVFLQLASPYPD